MPEISDKPEKSKPDKADKSQRRIKTKQAFLNKVVIRKLPPNLNEDAFLEVISPIPDYSSMYFVCADWTLGADASSRAYIEFKNQEDVSLFYILKTFIDFETFVNFRFSFSKISLMDMFL